MAEKNRLIKRMRVGRILFLLFSSFLFLWGGGGRGGSGGGGGGGHGFAFAVDGQRITSCCSTGPTDVFYHCCLIQIRVHMFDMMNKRT